MRSRPATVAGACAGTGCGSTAMPARAGTGRDGKWTPSRAGKSGGTAPPDGTATDWAGFGDGDDGIDWARGCR